MKQQTIYLRHLSTNPLSTNPLWASPLCTKTRGITCILFTCALLVLFLLTILAQIALAQPTNRAPDLATIAPQRAYVDLPLTIELKATDPDEEDQLLFGSFGPLPPGATIVEQGNGRALFQWTPNRIGEFEVIFTVSDDGLPPKSDSESTKILVFERSQADITAQVTQSPARATVGDRVDHGIEVRNLSDTPVQNVALTITHASTVDYIRAKNATCKEAKSANDEGIIRCTINDLNPFGDNGDTQSLTLTTQTNAPVVEVYHFNVWSISNDDPKPANNQISDNVEVSEVTQDKIQLELFAGQSPTKTVPLPVTNIEITTDYYDDMILITDTVSTTTDRNGNLQLALPSLDLARIDLNVSITKSLIITTPIIDFEFSLNNMPPTGLFTTTVSDDQGSIECTNVHLWKTNGSSQTGECINTSSHSWSAVTDASHATFSGRLTTLSGGDTQVNAVGVDEPLQLTLTLVNQSAPSSSTSTLFLPSIRR